MRSLFQKYLSCCLDEQHFAMAVSMPRDRFSKHYYFLPQSNHFCLWIIVPNDRCSFDNY